MSERAAVMTLLETCFRGRNFSSLCKLAEGWDNTLWLSDGLIYRIPKRKSGDEQARKEAALLQYLRTLGLSVPDPVVICRGSNTLPFVFAYLPIAGAPVLFAVSAGAPVYSPERWREHYRKLALAVERNVVPLLPPGKRGVSRLFSDFVSNDSNFEFRPVLIHRDLSCEHILVRDQRLAGVIDFGDSCIGDPAMDFAGLSPEDAGSVAIRYIAADERDCLEPLLHRASFYRSIAPCYAVLQSKTIRDPAAVARALSELSTIPV